MFSLCKPFSHDTWLQSAALTHYFVYVQLECLQLTFVTSSTEELLLKVEIEVVNEADVLKWDGNTALFRTATIKPKIVDKPFGGRDNFTDADTAAGDKIDAKEGKSVTCIVDFNGGLYKRSSYITLDNKTVCSLANATVNIRCYQIREAAAVAQEAPSKKGTEKLPPVAVILEEKITEMIIPLSSLLVLKGHSITGAFCFDDDILRNASEHEIRIETTSTGLGINLSGAESSLSFKLAADNNLAVSLWTIMHRYHVEISTRIMLQRNFPPFVLYHFSVVIFCCFIPRSISNALKSAHRE